MLTMMDLAAQYRLANRKPDGGGIILLVALFGMLLGVNPFQGLI